MPKLPKFKVTIDAENSPELEELSRLLERAIELMEQLKLTAKVESEA